MEGGSTSTSRHGTRISAACSICRAKKRKCSGEKPICAECKALNLACEWPKQLKRGPAKHYVRTLEARLRRTEVLLRSLLNFVSDEQLTYVLRDDGPLATPRGSSPVGDGGERADPELWQLYPLTGPEDVRAWQNDGGRRLSSASLLVGQDHGQETRHDFQQPSLQQQQQPEPPQPEHDLIASGNNPSPLAGQIGRATRHGGAGNRSPMIPASSSSSYPDPTGTDQLYPDPQSDVSTVVPGERGPGSEAGHFSTPPTGRVRWNDPAAQEGVMMSVGAEAYAQHDGAEVMYGPSGSTSFLPSSFQKEYLW